MSGSLRCWELKDERLKAVLALIGRCGTLADVGCDHGWLSAAAVLSGAADKALASDISPVSAGKAERLAKRLGIADRMTAVCADGLAPAAGLEPPFSIAVCGMGGELIARILEEGRDTARKADIIVMQPMRGEAELREYLFRNGYGITDERVIRDGKLFYQIVAAVPNGENTIPEGFPKDWFRFGWAAAQNHPEERVPAVEVVEPLLNDVDGTAELVEAGYHLTAHAELLCRFGCRLGCEVHVRARGYSRCEILEERQLRKPEDVFARHLVLTREDLVEEPVLKVQVVRK